jgi:serine/threonine-protein kinase HipA
MPRIHQEDFCQALGIIATKKYQNEGGPSFKRCFDLLKKMTQPAIDRNLLTSALVFNYLIGNMDAHGKNFSLLHTTQHNVRLAPFYDIICTGVYPETTRKMAMKIGSQYEFDKVFPRHWEQLCKDTHLSYPGLKQILENQGELILTAAENEKNNLIQMGRHTNIIDKIIKIIDAQIRHCLKEYKI